MEVEKAERPHAVGGGGVEDGDEGAEGGEVVGGGGDDQAVGADRGGLGGIGEELDRLGEVEADRVAGGVLQLEAGDLFLELTGLGGEFVGGVGAEHVPEERGERGTAP